MRLRLNSLRLLGWIVNSAGLPGFVREGAYVSSLGVAVQVRTSVLYTVVTVNDVDVFFYRLTGDIDGVGIGCGSRGDHE